MEPGARHSGHDEEEEEETSAGSCPICHPTIGVTVALVTIIIVTTGLLLSVVLLATWRAAPEAHRTPTTSEEELVERLQQCRTERHDLDLMLQAIAQDSRCRLCPGGWLWWRRHCYFFSVGLEENRQWNGSAEFCLGHNSSLAVIKTTAEMDFIQGVIGRFPRFPFLWVGLTDAQQEGRWLWGDGKDVEHYMP
nr:PREDICTED: CD209 antigen-like protein E [Paralichthys olivaceus]